MSALLAQAQQVQQKLMEAQEQLANTEVHGQAGGGLVQVTMKGSGEVVGVSIDPKVVDPDDVETLQDLDRRRVDRRGAAGRPSSPRTGSDRSPAAWAMLGTTGAEYTCSKDPYRT